jgi:hypothetical protein
MDLRNMTAILIVAIILSVAAGCSPSSSELSDKRVARALAEAVRLNHIFENVEGAADSIGGRWSEWLLQEGITRPQLERALESRSGKPAKWAEIVTFLETRKDSLFVEEEGPQADPELPDKQKQPAGGRAVRDTLLKPDSLQE